MVKTMKKLDIYKPYIDELIKNDTKTFFENGIGYYAYYEPDLDKKIKEIEERNGVYVWAITHEFVEFGELYDLLIIPKDTREWKYVLQEAENNTYYSYAYVWNKSDEWCSEFGDIAIKAIYGGIKRVA